MANSYDVNYDDKRFAEVETDKKAALSEVEKTYGGMINNADKYYQDQIDAANDWAETQKQNQQAQTDFAIEQIEQQKAQAQKDYTKEQSGAYTDWQKQSNPYGANAEAMAAQGMANGGYAESSQVSMYNTYQSRITAARESYNLAVMNYNNAIKDARLQNNSRLAEIAYQALQTQLELSLQGFQYKNTLVLEKANQKRAIEDTYYGRYQDVLKQINTENALAEEVRQYNANLAEQKRQHNANMKLQRDRFNEEVRQFNQLHPVVTAAPTKANTNYKLSGKNTKKKITNDEKKLDKTNKNTSSSKVSGSKGATVDMKSVLNLGFGPISEKRLNELVESGIVQEYESNGKIKFKKSPYAQKQFSALK